MALVLADVGADLILNTFFNATAQQNLKLKLYNSCPLCQVN